MPANECPSLSSPRPEERTANSVPAGSDSSHGCSGSDRISSSVASLGIAIPLGTGTPACRRRAQLNDFPPIRGWSPPVTSSSVRNISTAISMSHLFTFCLLRGLLEPDHRQADDSDGVEREPEDRLPQIAHRRAAQHDAAQ